MTRRAAPCCPASSTRTRTWCSRGSGPPSSRRGWRAARTQAGGIRSTVAATRAATDAELRAGLRRLAAEMLRQGTTTFECKSGYGLTVADEARSVALAAEVTARGHLPGRARGARRVRRRRPADYVDLVCGPMLDGLRAALPLGRRVLRARRVRRRRGARGAHRGHGARPAAADPREPARPRPGHPAGGRARRRLGRPLHVPHRRRRGRPRVVAAPSPPCCLARSSAPGSPTRTPAACSTRARRSRWRPTATPARPTPRRCRSASRSRSATCA